MKMKLTEHIDPNRFCIDDILDYVKLLRKKQKKMKKERDDNKHI